MMMFDENGILREEEIFHDVLFDGMCRSNDGQSLQYEYPLDV